MLQKKMGTLLEVFVGVVGSVVCSLRRPPRSCCLSSTSGARSFKGTTSVLPAGLAGLVTK